MHWENLLSLSQYSPPLFAKCTLPVDDDLLRAALLVPLALTGCLTRPTGLNAASRVLTHRLHQCGIDSFEKLWRVRQQHKVWPCAIAKVALHIEEVSLGFPKNLDKSLTRMKGTSKG